MPGQEEFPGKKILIKVCGVGGGGGNAVERMISNKWKRWISITINTGCTSIISIQCTNKNTDWCSHYWRFRNGSDPKYGACAAEEVHRSHP
jgi:cell division GTPase FtsZ